MTNESTNILIVDDEQDVIELITLHLNLSKKRFNIFKTVAVAEALKLLERHKIDLLISDVRMPGNMDGLALAKKAKEMKPLIRVLTITGRQDYTDEMIFGAGANAILRKPFTSRSLIESVEKALEK